MIDFACGMALEGKKVFAYAMAPFLSLRCLEQHKTATCLMNLDVRGGREIEKRRQLATAYFILVNTLFKISKDNQYVTFTEHKGEDFHLIEKYLEDWVANDKPLSD